MNEGKSQPWYRLFTSTLFELDPKQFIERVDASEAAIHGRLRDLQYDSDHHEERQLMADAQHTLALLRHLSFKRSSSGGIDHTVMNGVSFADLSGTSCRQS